MLFAPLSVASFFKSLSERPALPSAGCFANNASTKSEYFSGDSFTTQAAALAAREENPDVRLVVRLFNQRLLEKVQREIPHCRALDVAALAAPVKG